MRRIIPQGIQPKYVILIVGLAIVSFAGGLLVAGSFGSSDGAKNDAQSNPEASEATPATVWTCSMHPQVRHPEKALCPLCAMDLIPLTGNGDDPGPKTVVLSERAKILAKITTTPVRRRGGSSTDMRLLGKIEPKESAIKNVTAWTGGRIDRLHVKVTGATVRAGQVIATLYSPEVFSAHQDLIVAKQQLTRMSQGTESSQSAARRVYEASQNRLRLLGVPENDIQKLETKNKPNTQIPIRTPFSGTVVERVATEGAYVETGSLLYKIVNLSHVWVQLDAYESDLSGLSKGQEVTIHVEGISNDTFVGKIAFIDPTLDPSRRVARVRVEVDNRDGRLRPGMFVEAEVKSSLAKGASPPLMIPDTAPLFTGRRAVVFVEDLKGDRPTYTARTVRLGLKTGNKYPVVAGLSEGERIVTKGAFTLDADLQIRGGKSMMTEPDDTALGAVSRIIPITTKERKKLAPTLEAYLELQRWLAADDFDKAKKAAKSIEKTSKKAVIKGPGAATKYWKEQRGLLQKHARHLASTSSVEEARGVFETLSNLTISILERLGNPLDTPVRLAFCSMAMGSKGASWVQKGQVVDNSYYGDAMRTCGEIQSTVDPGSHLLIANPSVPEKAAPAGGHQH